MITLEKRRPIKGISNGFPVKQSPMFVESAKGYYTHRVRSATLYNLHKKPHMAVSCWCGMTVFIGDKHRGNCFVNEPTKGRPICATCEGRVIGALGVDNFRINGRIVRHSPRT